MRTCIVGSGIAGLSTAFYLTGYEGTQTVVYERAAVLGGRANVVEGAEHCARLFLDDYTHLLDILRQIPGRDGRSLHDELRPVERYCHTRRRGWVRTSHLYPLLARELSLRDKFAIALRRRQSPLLAAQELGRNTNRFGSRKNFSYRSIARIAANAVRSKTAYTLEGATDTSLLAPWVRLLKVRGVAFNVNTSVRTVRPEGSGVFVQSDKGAERFDAVVVTAFAPDMIDLLAASGITHSAERLQHTHCKCLTVTLDPREKVLVEGVPALYSRDGITVIVQPTHARCVALVSRSPNTDDRYVLAQVRDFLNLAHDILDFAVRDNQQPDEALYTADYLDPRRLLGRPQPNLYFAGSYIRNSYPVDSGEGAARSALAVVRQMQSDHGLVGRPR
jgi:glycine/D-amino acid oxidase-like deaminating enzyme